MCTSLWVASLKNSDLTLIILTSARVLPLTLVNLTCLSQTSRIYGMDVHFSRLYSKGVLLSRHIWGIRLES